MILYLYKDNVKHIKKLMAISLPGKGEAIFTQREIIIFILIYYILFDYLFLTIKSIYVSANISIWINWINCFLKGAMPCNLQVQLAVHIRVLDDHQNMTNKVSGPCSLFMAWVKVFQASVMIKVGCNQWWKVLM